MDGRFDELLLGMAQKHRGIEDLLYTIMSFYERRTDLFHVKEGDEKKGFEEGRAEEALRNQFQAYQARYLARAQPHLLAQRSSSGSSSRAAASLQGPASSQANASRSEADVAGGGFSAASSGAAAGPGGQAGAKKDEIPMAVNASPLDGGDPGLWEKKQNQEAPGFVWTQSVQEVTLEINVEKCSAADIKVVMAPRKISVKRKGQILVEGQLNDKINCEDSTWHLDSGKQIILSLEKIKPMFWESFFADGSSGPGTIVG